MRGVDLPQGRREVEQELAASHTYLSEKVFYETNLGTCIPARHDPRGLLTLAQALLSLCSGIAHLCSP